MPDMESGDGVKSMALCGRSESASFSSTCLTETTSPVVVSIVEFVGGDCDCVTFGGKGSVSWSEAICWLGEIEIGESVVFVAARQIDLSDEEVLC